MKSTQVEKEAGCFGGFRVGGGAGRGGCPAPPRFCCCCGFVVIVVFVYLEKQNQNLYYCSE